MCTYCGKPRCVCDARNSILLAAAEIEAAYAVVDAAREAVRVAISRDAGLRPELVALVSAVSTFDRALEARRDS